MPSRASSPTWRKGLPRTTAGGGGQRSPGVVAARATNQTSDKQQAAAMMEETIDNVGAVPREVSADAGYSRQRQSTSFMPGRGPVRRAGADPPRPGCATRAPRSHTQIFSQGPDATEVTDQAGSAALRFADANCGAGIRPVKQGRGFRQFLLRGLEKVNGEWSLISPATTYSNCSALGSICTGKHGAICQPQRIRHFAEVVSTALFAKLSGAGRRNRQN